MNSEVDYLRRITANAIGEEAARLERIGKECAGFCFGCGRATGDLAHCGCDFPSALRCAGGKLLCADCRSGHLGVSKHLSKMFASPPVKRVDAIRARLARFLRSALTALSERYNDSHAVTLRRHLSELDSYLDPKAEFKRDVLDIFSRSKFSRWLELAEELRNAEHEFYLESVIASGILGR